MIVAYLFAGFAACYAISALVGYLASMSPWLFAGLAVLAGLASAAFLAAGYPAALATVMNMLLIIAALLGIVALIAKALSAWASEADRDVARQQWEGRGLDGGWGASQRGASTPDAEWDEWDYIAGEPAKNSGDEK